VLIVPPSFSGAVYHPVLANLSTVFKEMEGGIAPLLLSDL